jgi:CRP/FNR family cyclic AMP-dependent transcriptional regulator
MDTSVLRAIPIFSELSDDQLRSVGSWANERSVSEGETLVREGDFSYDLFFVADGTAEVSRAGEHVADLGPGDVFGEIGVLTDAQRNATVTARSSMRLLTLSHWDLDKLRKQIPELDARVREAMRQHLGA